MSMISGSDERVRNAFRANLLEEPSRPNMTQELDANDILEVSDLANAIERAERSLRTPLPAPLPTASSSKRPRDIFEALTTDDASGPAVHAPARPTPVPPPPPGTLRSPVLAAPATLLPPVVTPIPTRVAPGAKPAPTSSAELQALTAAREPASSSKPAPHVLTLPPTMPRVDVATAMEDDAYFHPGARIRGLADESLQIYRPEPTLLVRARARRRTVSWVVLAVVPALLMLAAAAFFLRPTAEPAPAVAPQAQVTTTAAATAATAATVAPKPAVTAEAKPIVSESKPAVSESKPAVSESKPPMSQAKPAKGEVPVFDVNSLPPARPTGRR